MPTIRILLTIAVTRQWSILQLDVSNAFLHGDLAEEFYMRQPPGFEDTAFPSSVCKLNKSLYGLKQAPRQWFEKLTGNDQVAIQSLLTKLKSQFALRQLGHISLFLGIQVIRRPSGLFLTQQHYAQKLLDDSGFADCKPTSTPTSPKTPATEANTQMFDNPSLYRRLAGSLQYLSITRPDIAFATNQICQHMHKPTIADFQSLKRLLRYIKGTISFGLPITPGDLTIQTFTDADWASDASDRKSISGYCIFLGPNLIS
ncbi:uncharacterized protein LOC110099671 [Dendrobium catenatum]|uniref:uncharacterized protein LOC110099671 n=1 Tax=Dendrobium catenatum TaxID=906689 RepID=UPI0009F181A9|nr:uncharacterized protein LOC110099671 [Dendrobium catenatum]